MEITKTVSAIRTTLNKIAKSLECDLGSISGQDERTVQLIDTIVKDLRLESLFDIKDDDQLRNFHFLLFLNTNLKIAAQLETDTDVGHVVGAIPQLSSRLYFALTSRHGLLKYIKEVILNCPIFMILELLEIIDTEVKCMSAFDRFEILSGVLEVVSIRLMKTDCEFSLKKLAQHFQQLMLHYRKPIIDAEESTKKSKKQIVDEGYKFSSLISLFLSMTREVFSDIRMEAPCSPIYIITIPFDVTQWFAKSELMPKPDIIRKCYESVFFKCRELMEELDLDMFLTWYEVPINHTNLQTLIGEEVFYLCRCLQEERLKNLLPPSAEILISMLSSIAQKPVNSNEEKCSNTDNLCLDELILKNDRFDKSFLQDVERFLENSHFKPSTSVTLVRKLFQKETCPDIDHEYIGRIIVAAMQQLEIHDLKSLLSEFIATHGLDHFMIKQDNDFLCLLKLLSSLLTKDDIDSGEQEEEFVKQRERETLVKVALMGFHATYTDLRTVIVEGCSDRHDVIVFIKLLETLKALCSYQVEPESGGRSYSVLVKVLKEFLECDYQNLTSLERNNFNRLVVTLSNHQVMNRSEFLSVALLPLLYVNEDSDWSNISDLLLLFKDLYVSMDSDLDLHWPTLLIQIAQVLEDSRWSMTDFSDERMVACQRAIDMVHVLMRNPKEVVEPVRRWMETQLKTYSFLTRSYFTSIYHSEAISSIDMQLASFIHKSPESHQKFMEEYSKNENVYTAKMGQLLLSCTQNEIQSIVENYAQRDRCRTIFLFDWMSDSITFISNSVWHSTRQNMELVDVDYICLGALIRNFLCALLKNLMVEEKIDYIKYINRIITVVKKLPERCSRVYQFNILKFLVEEVPKMNKLSPNFDDNVNKLLLGLYVL